MVDLTTLIGFAAGACTSLSSFPQVLKVFRTRETADLSMPTLIVLTSGLALWVIYGFARLDVALISANGIGLILNATLVMLKARSP